VAPFFALIAALTAVAVKTQLGQHPDDVSFYMAFVLVGLVLARQMLLLTDLIESGEDREGTLFERLYSALERAEPGAPR
jgi:hypothetical protein